MYIFYGFVFIIGLFVGSFISMIVYRIPRSKKIFGHTANCTNCNESLEMMDRIPVLSYFFLRGKCRYCGKKISYQYIFIEVSTALVFLLLSVKYNWSIDFLAFAYLMAILITVFFIDIEHRIIPDELVLAGLIGGFFAFLYNIFSPLIIYGNRTWWDPLAGMLVGSGILLLVAILGSVLYRNNEALGGGDIKIFAPIGLFLGIKMTIIALLITIFLGGLAGLLLLIIKRNKKGTFPYGPYIVAGVFIVIMWGYDLLGWYLS